MVIPPVRQRKYRVPKHHAVATYLERTRVITAVLPNRYNMDEWDYYVPVTEEIRTFPDGDWHTHLVDKLVDKVETLGMYETALVHYCVDIVTMYKRPHIH